MLGSLFILAVVWASLYSRRKILFLPRVMLAKLRVAESPCVGPVRLGTAKRVVKISKSLKEPLRGRTPPHWPLNPKARNPEPILNFKAQSH